ncbi:transcription intermediary factor 1-beta-like [Scyliorhinus canicula]|uniref:transcription intermediary factor 1-beta-like n=1 Tax=Scyliorhinus canicula TaxID=7830 RepID=UPI0018F494C7|nr:transcription intermediary factor 1-beta-like [Scyliorhinus canicula]
MEAAAPLSADSAAPAASAAGREAEALRAEAEPPPPDAAAELSQLERCGVCREALRERQPRLLPCLHSMCKGCLSPNSIPQLGEGLICCPVCRQQCYTKDVIENYFLRDMGELDSNSNRKVSQVCTSCEDNAVSSSFCVECAEWLCDACVEAHQRVKFTKDHTMSKKNPGLTVVSMD